MRGCDTRGASAWVGSSRTARRLLALCLLLAVCVVAAPVAARADSSDPTDARRLAAATLMERELPGYAATTAKIMGPESVVPGVGHYADEVRSQTAVGGYQREFIDYGTGRYLIIELREGTSHKFAVDLTRRASLSTPSRSAKAPGAVFGTSPLPGGWEAQTGQFVKGRIVVTVTLRQEKATLPSPALLDVLDAEYDRVPTTPDLTTATRISLKGSQRSLLISLLSAIVAIQLVMALVGAVRDRGSREAFLATWRMPEPSGPFSDRVRWLVPVAHGLRRAHRRSVRWRTVGALALFTGAYFLHISFGWAAGVALGVVWVVTLIRNLVAQRTSSAAGAVPVGPLALMLSALSSAATLALVWVALMGMIIIITVRNELAPGPDEQRAIILLYGLGVLVLMAVAATLDRLTRRLNARRADRALERDHRPEIVFLRSFGDDALTLRSRQRRGRSLIARLSLRSRETLEQLLAWTAWRHGPVVAVAEPGTHLPPLGATRMHYADDRWQEEVARRIRDSAAVLLIAGRTQGLAWELNHVARLGALPKLIVLFPPLPDREVRQRVAVVYGALNIDPRKAPAARSASGRLISVGFDPQGLPVFNVTDGRDDTSYLLTVESELQRIEEQGPAEALMVHPDFLDVTETEWQGHLLPKVPRPGTAVRLWRRASARLTAGGALGIWVLNSFVSQMAPHEIPLPGTTVAQTAGLFAVTESGTVLSSSGKAVQLVRAGRAGSPVTLRGAPVRSAAAGETLYLGLAQDNSAVAVDASGAQPAQLWSQPLPGSPAAVSVGDTQVAMALPAQNQVVVLDRATGAQRAVITTGPTPTGVAFDGGRLLVTTAGNYAWTEYDTATGGMVHAGTLPSGATTLMVRGDDLYFFSPSTSNLARYSLSRAAIVSSVYVNGTGSVAFGQHTALACSNSPKDAAVLVDLDRMAIRSVLPAPSTPDIPTWQAGAYYFSFFDDPAVVRVSGS